MTHDVSSYPHSFPRRHIGVGPDDIAKMLAEVGYSSLDELIDAAVPSRIRTSTVLDLPAPASERTRPRSSRFWQVETASLYR